MAELYDGWYFEGGRVYFRTTDVNVYQPGDYQKTNILNIYNYFTAQGWTVNAIAGMVGNMMVESGVNPGCCQYASVSWDNPSTIENTSGGIGLTQWTPARKYYNWAIENNLDPKSGDTQCARIEWERDNNKQWSLKNLGNHTWEDFVTSTESPETLARVFVWAYERPKNPNIAQRQRNARWVYDYLTSIDPPTPPEPPAPDNWITGEAFADLAAAYDPDITGVDIPYSQLNCIAFVQKVWRDIPAVSSTDVLCSPLGTNTLWRMNVSPYPSKTFATTDPEGNNPTKVLWYKETISYTIAEFGGLPAGCLLFHQVADTDPPVIPAQYAGDGIGNFVHVGIYIGNNEVMQSGGMDSGSVPGGGVHRSVYNANAWNYCAFLVYVDPTSDTPPEPPGPEPPDPHLPLIPLLCYNSIRKKVLKNAKRII